LETALRTEAETGPRWGNLPRSRKARNVRTAGARESERCQAVGWNTLKVSFGDELERSRSEDHEWMHRREAAPPRARESRGNEERPGEQRSVTGCNTPAADDGLAVDENP
jgi:hypothetical protein